MTSIVVELALPPRPLSPNLQSSRHWRYRHGATIAARSDAHLLTLWALNDAGLGPDAFKKVCVSADFYPPHKGGYRHTGRYLPRDVQNGIASLKAYFDGISDALGVPDDAKHWQIGRVQIRPQAEPDTPQNGAVRITVEALDE